MGFPFVEGLVQNWILQDSGLGLMHQGGPKMNTFLMFGKASSEEMKEIGSKYKLEVVGLVNSFGGEVKSKYVMLRGKYLVFIFAFPGSKMAMKACSALSKLTGISFTMSPLVLENEFSTIT
jgi:hypothetical protein